MNIVMQAFEDIPGIEGNDILRHCLSFISTRLEEARHGQQVDTTIRITAEQWRVLLKREIHQFDDDLREAVDYLGHIQFNGYGRYGEIHCSEQFALLDAVNVRSEERVGGRVLHVDIKVSSAMIKNARAQPRAAR